MPQYAAGQNGGGNGVPATANGYSDQNSPNSSQISSEGQPDSATLISRTQKQHTTQKVTTTTKTIREIQYLGPDGQPLDPQEQQQAALQQPGAPPPIHPRLSTQQPANAEQYANGPYYQQGGYADYEHYGPPPVSARGVAPNGAPSGVLPGAAPGGYAEYPHRPPTPPSPSDRSASPPPQHREPDYMRQGGGGAGGSSYPPRSGYDELDTTLMPPRQGEQTYGQQPMPPQQPQPPSGLTPRHSSADDPSSHPSLQGSISAGYDPNASVFEDYGAPRASFDDEGDPAMPPMQPLMQEAPPPLMKRTSQPSFQSSAMDSQRGGGAGSVQWRDPDLHEVIEFLHNPNSVIKANAAAYLQHLCYMDDPVKAKTRQLGGIPPLVQLLSHDIPEIHRNSCGALRNLSYGRQNDENKRAIKAAAGVPALVRLLRKTPDSEVKELVTGVLWNLSSCDDLKRAIVDEALMVLVNIVIIPHSGWDPNGIGGDTVWSTVFRNASGILRNVSSAGDYGRKKLRECDGVVDAMLFLVKRAIEKANIDNKSVENCVCVLRNLSYRAQEVEDPLYDKKQVPGTGMESRAGAKPATDNLGCFGASKAKRKDGQMGGPGAGGTSSNPTPGSSRVSRTAGGQVTGMDLLWQPEVVQPYLNLLSNCSNPETLEAAAGAIQNLSACYWQPSIDVRAAVRKEKGLPILVELLRMEVDRVVCAVATALRNLAIDQRNKELIGKYAMRDLVQKLPFGNPQRDLGTSDDTIAAVLATLNEVIKKHPEFSRSLLEAGGVDRLMTISRQRQRFSSRVVKFASQVLYSMWVHQELREVYRKAGWKEQDFVTKTIAARNARPNSPTNINSTLNRPMASQGGTRYEDRTMQRGGSSSASAANNSMQQQQGFRPEDVPMENLSLYGRGQHPQGGAGVPMFQPGVAGNHHVLPGEPVYAQVNRDKKKNMRNNSQMELQRQQYQDYGEHQDNWQVEQQEQQQQQAGGDSWV